MCDDRGRMLDMLQAAEELVRIAEELSLDDLENEFRVQLAVSAAFAMIGEAANHLTEEGKQSVPQVKWRTVVDFRNRIVHGYDEIDWAIVWTVMLTDIPRLIAAIRPHIPPPEQFPLPD